MSTTSQTGDKCQVHNVTPLDEADGERGKGCLKRGTPIDSCCCNTILIHVTGNPVHAWDCAAGNKDPRIGTQRLCPRTSNGSLLKTTHNTPNTLKSSQDSGHKNCKNALVWLVGVTSPVTCPVANFSLGTTS